MDIKYLITYTIVHNKYTPFVFSPGGNIEHGYTTFHNLILEIDEPMNESYIKQIEAEYECTIMNFLILNK